MARLYDEEVIEEFPIPLPETVSRGRVDFGGAAPLPAGTMNAGVPNQVYATPENNAYIAEQRALASVGMSPQQQRQKALMEAEIQEQAIRTKGQLSYQRTYESLIKGGATPPEASMRALWENANEMNWNDPRKPALLLDMAQATPEATPQSINAVPVLGAGGNRVADAVYAGGKYRTTLGTGVTPEQLASRAETTIGKERRDQIAAELRTLYRAQADAVNKNDKRNLPRIAELESQLEGMRSQATGGKSAPVPEPKAAPAPTVEKVIVVKDGKRFRLPKSQLDDAIKGGYTLSK